MESLDNDECKGSWQYQENYALLIESNMSHGASILEERKSMFLAGIVIPSIKWHGGRGASRTDQSVEFLAAWRARRILRFTLACLRSLASFHLHLHLRSYACIWSNVFCVSECDIICERDMIGPKVQLLSLSYPDLVLTFESVVDKWTMRSRYRNFSIPRWMWAQQYVQPWPETRTQFGNLPPCLHCFFMPRWYIALISTKIFSQLLYDLWTVITGFGQICLNLNPGPWGLPCPFEPSIRLSDNMAN